MPKVTRFQQVCLRASHEFADAADSLRRALYPSERTSMYSSGIKRGLAASAIAAMAVAGAPFLASAASAAPLGNQVTATTFVNPSTGAITVSTLNDGTNSTYKLEVLAPDTGVAATTVTQVRFSYTSATQTTPAVITTTAANDNGAFSVEWTPPAGVTGAITLRADGLNAAGNLVGNQATQAVTVNNAYDTTNIADANLGPFFAAPAYQARANVVAQQPKGNFVAIKGTSSSATDNPLLQYFTPAAGGNVAGFTGDTNATSSGSGNWSGVLSVADALVAGGANANNQLLVKATSTVSGANTNTPGLTDSSDTEGYQLFQQQITSVTATPASTTVANGQTVPVTVTVKDQESTPQPIAGVQVQSSDGAVAGYTDANGQVVLQQAAGTQTYIANNTDDLGYQPNNGDVQSAAVTITGFAPVNTAITATSRDGNAFDFDEFDYSPTAAPAGTTPTAAEIAAATTAENNSDIVVSVNNQNGSANSANAGRTISYYFVDTPFDGTAAVRYPSATTTSSAIIDANGKATINLPAGAKAGNFVLYAALDSQPGLNNGLASSNVLTFKAGNASLAFTGANPLNVPAGTSTAITGKEALEDGTTLAGRTVTLTKNGTGNAFFTPTNGQTGQPTTATVVTGNDGTFSATLNDPAATPQASETDTIRATSVTRNRGTATAVDTFDPNATTDNGNGATRDLTVNFYNGTVATGTTETIATDNGTYAPGQVVTGTVQLTAPLTGGNVGNVGVVLKTDNGFFTDGTSVAGANVPSHKSLGTTTTVVTDATGQASFQLTLEGNSGFADDGVVVATVTATAGSVSDTEDYGFSTDETRAYTQNDGNISDFRHLSKVAVVRSDASAQVNPTGPTPTGGVAKYDLFVYDAFGNPVKGNVNYSTTANGVTTYSGQPNTASATITASGNASFAAINGNGAANSALITADYDSNGDFQVTDTKAEDVLLTANLVSTSRQPAAGGNQLRTVTNSKATYASDGTANADVANPLTGTATETFYDRQLTTVTITSNANGAVKVGTPVTETVTVKDDKGQPIAGYGVNFIRTGPGNETGTGDGNVASDTNQNGQAFYTFVGGEEGTAKVTATVSNVSVNSTTSPTQSRTVTNSVVFSNQGGTTPTGPKATVKAHVFANDNGGKADKLKVKVGPKAGGANVQIKINGKRVARGSLNGSGIQTFNVRDRNGNKATTYKIKVNGTKTSKQAFTSVKVK